MKLYCRRGGFCTPRMVGFGPTEDGVTVRVCTRGGEIYFTDRPALNLPAQPGQNPREPLDAEAEQLCLEEVYS